MAAPTFPVMRRVQQSVYQLFVRIRRRIGDKRFGLGEGWRQPRKIKISAAQQSDLFGVGPKPELLLRHRVHQKRIYRSADAVSWFRLWNRGLVNRLKRPEGAFFVGDAAGFFDVGRLGAGGFFAPSDPPVDPRHFVPRLFLIALWHLAALNLLEEQAFFGFARDDDGPFIATLEHQSAQAQIQAAFQLLTLAVTIETMRLEDGSNVLLEGGGSGGERGCGNQQQCAGNDPGRREETTNGYE